MAAANHEPIKYLDCILNEEEKRQCEYGHEWRNFTISRSGRFKTKNKHRDLVYNKMFDHSNSNNNSNKDVMNSFNPSKHTEV